MAISNLLWKIEESKLKPKQMNSYYCFVTPIPTDIKSLSPLFENTKSSFLFQQSTPSIFVKWKNTLKYNKILLSSKSRLTCMSI